MFVAGEAAAVATSRTLLGGTEGGRERSVVGVRSRRLTDSNVSKNKSS